MDARAQSPVVPLVSPFACVVRIDAVLDLSPTFVCFASGANVTLGLPHTQYAIFFTFLAAVTLKSDLTDRLGLTEAALGVLLVSTNCVILIMATWIARKRYQGKQHVALE